jgi:hypothetical protein
MRVRCHERERHRSHDLRLISVFVRRSAKIGRTFLFSEMPHQLLPDYVRCRTEVFDRNSLGSPQVTRIICSTTR